MDRRTFLVSSAAALAGTTYADVELREYRGKELERAIAARIGDERHRWVDIAVPFRDECGPHYQITNIHHNLTRLDEAALSAVDDITREWNLTVQEDAKTESGFTYRTLTHHSESAKEHRRLAETVLQRVYGVELAAIADVSQVDGEPDDTDGNDDAKDDEDSTARGPITPSKKDDDWAIRFKYERDFRKCYALLAERGSVTGDDFLEVQSVPGRAVRDSPENTPGEYPVCVTPTLEQFRKSRRNGWLGKLFTGLFVLAEEYDGNIRPPEDATTLEKQWRYYGGASGAVEELDGTVPTADDAPLRDQRWRYVGDRSDIDVNLGGVRFRDIVVEELFDYDD